MKKRKKLNYYLFHVKMNTTGVYMHIITYMSGGLSKHSLVHTNTGLIPITRIKNGDEVMQHDGTFSPVIYASSRKTKNTIMIKHEDGFIWCHKNQYIAVLESIDVITWKKAKKLKPDDIIISTRIQTPGIHTMLPMHDFQKSTTGRGQESVDLIVPTEFTTDHAWLIGVIHGDGYVSLRSKSSNGELSISFHTSETERAEKARNILLQFGGFDVTIKKRKDSECLIVRCASRQLYTYFHKHIKQSRGKFIIPDCILHGSVEHRKAYLSGLFDSDGCVSGPSIELASSTYTIFLKKIQEIAYSCIGETRLHGPYKNDYKTTSAVTSYPHFYRERSGSGSYNCSLHVITTWSMWHFNNPSYHCRLYETRMSKKANGFPKKFTDDIDQSIRVKRGLNGNRPSIRYNIDSYTHDNGDLWYCPVTVKEIVKDTKRTTMYDIRTESGVMIIGGFIYGTKTNTGKLDLSDVVQDSGIYKKISDELD